MDKKLKKKLSILKAKNKGRKYKNVYLRELEHLIIPNYNEDRILSLEKTLGLSKVKGNVQKHSLSFDNKRALKIIIEKLISIKDGEVFLISQYSLLCGAYALKSLREFNSDFEFKAEHQGLIQLRLADISNELLLDFYEENGERLLVVEIIGNEWLKT